MKLPYLLTAMLAGGMPLLAQQPNLDTESQRQLADGLYARGMYGLAAPEYAAYLETSPEADGMDACWFRLGECYRQTGNTSEAEKAYQAVFTRYPESEFRHKAGFQRANLFLDAARTEEALDLFDLLLSESPAAEITAAALFLKGEAALRLDRTAVAREAFGRIRDRHPESEYYVYALLKLSALLNRSEDPASQQEALALLSTAEKKAPTDRLKAETLFQLAERYFELSDFQKSAPYYQALLETYPGDPRAREAPLRAAWALHNAGLYADALKTASDAIAAGEDGLPDWLYLKANCERQLSRGQEAVETYRRFLEGHPDGDMAEAARYELALTLYRMKDYPGTIAALTVPGRRPESRENDLWILAESHAALSQFDQAIQHYRLLVREFPSSAVACDASYRLAYQLQQRKDLLEAARYYLQLFETCRTNALAPQALFAAGYCLATESQHADAVQAWDSLEKAYPGHEHVQESLFRRAMSEIHLNRNEDALASLRRLETGYPETGFLAELHYWKGMLHVKAERYHDAENAFERAEAASPREELGREVAYQHAVSLYFQKKYDLAAARIQPLLDTPVRSRLTPRFLQWLATYRLERGEHGPGLAAARILAESGDTPDLKQTGWCLAGRCLKRDNRLPEAAEAFEAALALKEATAYASEAALELGMYALESGRAEQALGYLNKAAGWSAAGAAPGIRPRAYFGLAKTHHALGSMQEAARYYMSVAILYDDPEIVPECLYQAAQIYRGQGLEEDARKTAMELKSRYPASPWATRPMSREAGQ